MGKLTHLDRGGKIRMVNVTTKTIVEREALARAILNARPETISAITSGNIVKGNVTATAKVAAIAAAKNTAQLIPLCHPLRITHIDVAFDIGASTISIKTTVKAVDRTGVEMEALVAAAVAALTIYDMCKAIDKTMSIKSIELLKKIKKPGKK